MSSSADACGGCGLRPVADGPRRLPAVVFHALTLGQFPFFRKSRCEPCGRRRDLWMLASLVVLVPVALVMVVLTVLAMAIG